MSHIFQQEICSLTQCANQLLAKPTKSLRQKTTLADFPSTSLELPGPSAPAPVPLWATRQPLFGFHSKMCSVCRLPPTIAASPEDYIWRRCLPGAGAEGVQAVEGIIAAVSRGRQGVTTLGIPAVDITTVSDTPLRTLKVLGLLCKNKPSNKRQTLEQHTRSLPHYRKTSLQWPPKIPASSVHRNRL